MSKVFIYKEQAIGGGTGGSGGKTYIPGDHITISPLDVISSNQADEMTYAEYQQLSQSEIMDGTIRFLDECPDDSYCWYDAETKTLWFEEGFAQYDSETKTLWV